MTATLPPETEAQVGVSGAAGVLASTRGQVAALFDELWAAKTPEQLLAVNTEIERLRSVLAAVQVEVAAEIGATGAAKTDGWASPADYLTHVAGARRGSGRRLLHTGAALTSDRPRTLQALRDARVSLEQAEVIVRAIDRLPVDARVRDAAETVLLEEAMHLDATELAKAGDHLLELLDPDGHARREEKHLDKLERSAHLNRFLAIVEDGLGGVRIKGRGTVEDAAVLKATLASLSAPLASTDPECGLEGSDPRDHGARTWDALVEACQRLQDAQVLPEDHGMKPRVVVTLDYDALRAGIGLATLDTGESLSAAAVRKLACDAEVIPAVLNTAGAVLDTGRGQRLVTALIWTALVVRDRHCRFPGCRRPPVACDAHHLVHWADGGPTSLDNLVLLCRAHHTILHSTGWQVRLNPGDRQPEFKPPPNRRLGPDLHVRLDRTEGWVRERCRT